MTAIFTIAGAVIGLLFSVEVILLVRVGGDLATDEIRGWLDIAPRAILRLAGARLNREQRARLYHEEWLPELQHIMREAETRPITRAIRALGFAFGLLLAARAISRLRPPTPPPAVANDVHSAVGGVVRYRDSPHHPGGLEVWDPKRRIWVLVVETGAAGTGSAPQPSTSAEDVPPYPG